MMPIRIASAPPTTYKTRALPRSAIQTIATDPLSTATSGRTLPTRIKVALCASCLSVAKIRASSSSATQPTSTNAFRSARLSSSQSVFCIESLAASTTPLGQSSCTSWMGWTRGLSGRARASSSSAVLRCPKTRSSRAFESATVRIRQRSRISLSIRIWALRSSSMARRTMARRRNFCWNPVRSSLAAMGAAGVKASQRSLAWAL